jgi:hypothetical protein
MDSNTNKDIGYINHEELVFNSDNSIQSGGFSVSSIFIKSGISPIMTMNINTESGIQNGGSNKVSDLFQNLAVPNWAIMYKMTGGEYKEKNDSDSDIDDELHDKLLDLVRDHENNVKKKNNKSKKMENREKKNITKKRRKQKE